MAIYEEEEIDGEMCQLVHHPGNIERLTADDGVYEGEVADVLDADGEKVRTIPHGRGIFSWNNGDVYEGEWRYNLQNGKGKFTYADGGYFQGDWLNDEQHGYGFLKDCNGEFEGEFDHECRSGKGKQKYNNNDVYTGQWFNDKRHGVGSQKWEDGAVYEGEWANDTMHGKGLYIFENGDRYDGDFCHDQKTGIGEYQWADSVDQLVKYVGGFLNGKRHGEGMERYKNGNWQIGEWVEGVHQGEMHLHSTEPCQEQFHLESVKQASDAVRPFVSDRMWQLIEEANQKGERVQVPMPVGMEEELRKAHEEIQKVGEIVQTMKTAHEENKKLAQADSNGSAGAASDTNTTTSPTPFIVDVDTAAYSGNIDAFLKVHGSGQEDIDISPEAWKLGNMLGKGSYGAVYAGLRRDGGMMAVKCIQLGEIEDDEDINALINEIGVMRDLRHTNIVSYYGASKDPTRDILYIFLEYVPGGSLSAVIGKFGNLDLETCRRYTKQICYAIEFLHGTGVIHRDIKGDNILLTGDGIVKLADFGCSKALLSLQAGTHGVTAKTMVGTPHWMAPEVIKNQDQGYSFTADIWSIGCTVVEMLTGKPPWPEFSSMWGAVFHIANSTGPPDNVPSDIPAATKEFLEHCFERDTSLRFSSTQLLKTPWMQM